ncbi:MAG: class I SAM-dependent methyltransferase [Firmicutes bacterium]|nr:class I SAM-dependent methyltransferase [Bacillota bacterium]
MLDLIGYNEGIFDRRVVDFSCGDGNILVEVVNRYINAGRVLGKTDDQIRKGLELNIYGVEIKAKFVKKCRQRLDEVASTFGLTEVNWKIVKGDGLRYKFDIKFHYAVLNPPYIAYALLTEKERIFVKENFETCRHGKFDYSYAFIERGIKLLEEDGVLVCITPSNFFKTQFGRNLREFSLPFLASITDYSRVKVFEKVLTSPAISVFSKVEANVVKYIDKSTGSEKIIQKQRLGEKWVFSDVVNNGNRRFGDYFKISNSVATLANKVFIVDAATTEKHRIELGALREAVSPKTRSLDRQVYIVFPYEYIENSLVKIGEERLRSDYPFTYAYMESKKSKLEERDSDQSCMWFEFGRSQALSSLNQEKLMVSSIMTKAMKVYRVGERVIPYSGFYIVPKREIGLDVAEEVLRSQSMIDYLLCVGIPVSGESVRISTKDIESFRF